MSWYKIMLLCITVHFLMIACLSWLMSINKTENGHIGSTVYLWNTGRFEVFHVNPPLTRYIVGPSILVFATEYGWKSYAPRPQDRSEWQIGRVFIDANPRAITTDNRFADSWLGHVPIPLPGEFVQGIDTQKLDFERGIESYLRGEYSQHGWWHYYAYTILIKEPLGTLCLGLLALFVTIFLTQYNASWRDEMVIILPGLVFFIFVSSQTGFSLHPRYIIPVLPFAYIWISKLGQSFTQKRYVLSTVTTVLLIWMIGSSLYHFPHSMSYFNELIGGPKNGPKHLLGSNVDWGQNAYFLQKWYNKHPDARPIRIAYTNSESLDRLGIKDNLQPPNEPEPGWFALGVNEIYSSSKQYDYFKQFEPVDRIGYSIYIYHVTPEEANRVRREMELPEIEGEVLHE